MGSSSRVGGVTHPGAERRRPRQKTSTPGQIGVLIIDAGHHHKISLGVARCLSLIPGVRLHVLSHTADVPVRWSRHRVRFHHERIDDDEAWLAAIERLAAQDVDVLLGVSEPGVRLLAQHRSRLENDANVAPGPSVDAFDIAVNKALYASLLDEHGVLIPRTVHVRATEMADGTFGEALAGLRPPLLLKPTRKSGGAGIRRFDDAAGVAAHLDSLPAIDDHAFIVQEVVSGRDICCAVLCDAGKPVAYSTYHALAPDNRFSPWSCSEFKIDEQIIAKTAEITKLLAWSGPANLDFIRSSEGELWAIEFNGRYDGSVLTSAQAGVNFPGLHLELGRGCTVEQPQYTPGVYLDHRGMTMQLWARLRRKPHVTFAYEQTYLPFIARDPLPEASMAVSYLRSLLPLGNR